MSSRALHIKAATHITNAASSDALGVVPLECCFSLFLLFMLLLGTDMSSVVVGAATATVQSVILSKGFGHPHSRLSVG